MTKNTTRFSVGVVASAAAMAVLTLPGCANDSGAARPLSSNSQATAPDRESQTRPSVDASVVRGSADYDYEPFDSILAAASAAELGAVGEVVGWSQGRTLEDGDERDYAAILQIRVTQHVAGDIDLREGHLYVEVGRGGEVFVEGEPFRHQGAAPSFRTVAELSQAVPEGTRVVVLGLRAPSDEVLERESATGKVIDVGTVVPEGSDLVSPFPQGLLFETAEGGIDSGVDAFNDGWGWAPQDLERDAFATLIAQLEG